MQRTGPATELPAELEDGARVERARDVCDDAVTRNELAPERARPSTVAPRADTADTAGSSVAPAGTIAGPVSWSRRRDAVLTAELRDRLSNDRRTAGLALDITVIGGVAHVRGEISSEEQRTRVRSLLRQQGGIYAVWDLLTLPGERLTLLDIGAGEKKQTPEAVGVDRVAYPGVDVVTDLEGPLPFADSSVDHIFAVHVLEHIHDLLSVMRELHRILRSTGALHVLTPYWRHVNAVADPTHVRLMDIQTLRYFTSRRPGVEPWRPLLAHQTDDTVFADLQPVKDGASAPREEIARWFY